MRPRVPAREEVIEAGGRDWLCEIAPAPDGVYITCEDLPPLLAFGETADAARSQARDEIEAWAAEHSVPQRP